MKIDNGFTVSLPMDRAWEVLTDLEGIAPRLPGAQLTSVDDGATGTEPAPVVPAPAVSDPAPSRPHVNETDAEPLDLMALAVSSLCKREVPLAAAVLALLGVKVYFARREPASAAPRP